MKKDIKHPETEDFQEGDRVIIDKYSISEQHGIIAFFFGDGYCEVYTDDNDRVPVNINRLSRNS